MHIIYFYFHVKSLWSPNIDFDTRPHINKNEIHSQEIYRGEIYGEKVLHTFPLENGINFGKHTNRTHRTMEVLKMIIGILNTLVSAFVQKSTMDL